MLKIKTIQFPDIAFPDHRAFLDFIQKEVIELALKNQEAFRVAGCNAEYFHKDKHHNKSVEVLIHSHIKDNRFALRAYTEPAIQSLDYWFLLFKNKYPEKCVNTITSQEHFEYKLLEKPIMYTSNNWIPYRDCKQINQHYYYTKKVDGSEQQFPADFKKQLFSNLVFGFLHQQLQMDKNILVDIKDFSIANNYKNIEALKTTKNNTAFYPIKRLFKVTFAVNVQLPSYFSLGQNPAYGNGIFIRDFKYSKIKSYEKIQPKPNQTE